jgi:SAM-dependent methyltransferase
VLPDLTTAEGRAEIEQAVAVARSVSEQDPVRRAARLRGLLEPDLATLSLSQSELRTRGKAKFGAAAEDMFFTSDGLQQATHAEVADHRARRFAAAGLSSVLDLCCGIGADVMAFARAGLAVSAIERDPATAAIAMANTHRSAARIEIGSAEDAPWREAESVFLDPARRTTSGRTFNPAAYSPAFDFVTTVLATANHAAAKLSPGFDHALIPAGVEAEWISYARGVKETVLWSSGFAQFRDVGASTGGPWYQITRRATVLPAGAQLTDADVSDPAVGAVGSYLYEPDGAVIRAGLVQQVAALLPGGRRIDEHLAYLSSDDPLDTPFARGYAVIGVLPYSVKRLRAELTRRCVGVVEIKTRGVDVDPAVLRRELKPKGPNSITVLLARVGDHRLAILAQPVARQPIKPG